jgi:hypothetical protein
MFLLLSGAGCLHDLVVNAPVLYRSAIPEEAAIRWFGCRLCNRNRSERAKHKTISPAKSLVSRGFRRPNPRPTCPPVGRDLEEGIMVDHDEEELSNSPSRSCSCLTRGYTWQG